MDTIKLKSLNFLGSKIIQKLVGDYLAVRLNSKIVLATLPPCFSNLLPHIYRVNHRIVFYKRAGEPFIEAPNSYDDKQDWLKNQNNLLEPIWQIGKILSRALVDIVDINVVEQEREQKVFFELHDFDDCVEEKQDTDFSTD